MKDRIFIYLIAVLATVGCNRQNTTFDTKKDTLREELKASDDTKKETWREELKVSDLVPCTICESEGYLVNPVPKDWSDIEKELYEEMIFFWEETTGFLFSSQMESVYLDEGVDAFKEKFISIIRAGYEDVEGVRWSFRSRFTPEAISQIGVMDVCDDLPPPPPHDLEGGAYNPDYHRWSNEWCRCVDLLFDTGVPDYLYVERPVITSIHGIVPFRLYYEDDGSGNPKLQSRFCFYFVKEKDRWVFDMRRSR